MAVRPFPRAAKRDDRRLQWARQWSPAAWRPGKKRRGGLVLQREGLTASQAINRMYDKLIENGDASFLTGIVAAEDEAAWDNAVEFVDSLSEPVPTAHPMPPMKRPRSWSTALSSTATAADGPDLAAIARAARFSSRGVI